MAKDTGITDYAMLIGGEWVAASDGVTFDSFDPSTGLTWARIPEATEADVDRAVRAADDALHGPWGTMTATERGRCLARLADLLDARSEDIGRVETRDTGKLFGETRWQAKYIAEYLRFYAGAADKLTGETLAIDKPDMFVFTEREPLGVIAAVIPWNSQMFLTAVKLGPALATGNTMVLKASEDASAPLLEFGRLIAEAGIPPGVVNIVTGGGEPCGRALTSHPLVARIAFTGGPGSARHVVRNSADNLAQVSLELGGKSPFIVFDDASIESAVNGCVAGIFGASGQSCVAGSRLLVQEGIAKEFVARLADVAKGIRIGDPQDEASEMGPLCTRRQLELCEAQVARAIEQGGRVVTGGHRVEGREGLYFAPTIVDCPHADMDILRTELFGPVLAVCRFADEAGAIEAANDTDFGLAAGIFTRDNSRAHRMARAVRAGIIWVNTYRAISPIAEFGGFKNSGYGREAGFRALWDYTRPKTVWMNLSDEPLANPFKPR